MTISVMSIPYFNPGKTVARHGGELPHWQQGDVFYFVTWRLADALPQEKLAQWREQRERWLRLHPRPWADETEEEYHHEFSDAMESWLDAGSGDCILREPEVAGEVAGVLRNRDGQDYLLDAFIVMPNHVHVLFRLGKNARLEQVIKAWKGVSARRINQMRGRQGKIWQEEYWDRIVRNSKHLAKCRKYIRENPVRLPKGWYLLFEGPADSSVVGDSGILS